jgi:N-acetylglucosaminyldiphosphoundecaprenol N-acetyl-beta-D-mannosaminyltransferase
LKNYSVFGINYSATDYKEATGIIIEKAKNRESFTVSALAVHGLISAFKDPILEEKVNKINLVVPDGQPVKWALNRFYNLELTDRIYGPFLTLNVLKKANIEGLSIFLYGSTKETLDSLEEFVIKNFPKVRIAGIHQDRFRDATEDEDRADIEKINSSGANIVLVGRGCPRQEIWVSDHLGLVNAPMLAVGAAFDFFAGTKPMAPDWMQKKGLEWLFRLMSEPRRLFGRYFETNGHFLKLYLGSILGGYKHYKVFEKEL